MGAAKPADLMVVAWKQGGSIPVKFLSGVVDAWMAGWMSTPLSLFMRAASEQISLTLLLGYFSLICGDFHISAILYLNARVSISACCDLLRCCFYHQFSSHQTCIENLVKGKGQGFRVR